MVVKGALLRRRRPLSGADLSPSVHIHPVGGALSLPVTGGRPTANSARGGPFSRAGGTSLEESTVRMPEVVNSDAKIIPRPVTRVVT